jgi:hypothetical protein
MPIVEVRSRIIGAVNTDDQPASVALDLLNETLTVRELIAHAVEEQIRDLLIHRKLDANRVQHILERQYLTQSEVEQQAVQGAIKRPSEPRQPGQIDHRAEVRKALTAFERGTIIVVVDGRPVETLDEMVTLSATSKATFMRLTPLVGG